MVGVLLQCHRLERLATANMFEKWPNRTKILFRICVYNRRKRTPMRRITHYDINLIVENDQLCSSAGRHGLRCYQQNVGIDREGEPNLKKAGLKIIQIEGPMGERVNAPNACDGCGKQVESGEESS